MGSEMCIRDRDMDPGFFQSYLVLGKAYTQKGIYPEAIRYLQKARELAGRETCFPPILATLALANERAGNHNQARQFVEELESVSNGGYVSPYWVGIAHFAVNETEQAFSRLQRACDLHDPWLFALPNSPIVAQFKSDNRYDALLRRIGLA